VAARDVRIVNLSMQDVYIRSNYQDHQRYQAVDLAINGDAQASLPALIDEVKRARDDDRQRASPRAARS
jgi:thiamine pyrophosphate-dependent acetolactate synthase large subunit-like protein